VSTLRFEFETLGDHVHVKLRSGSDAEAIAGQMPLAGTFVLSLDAWQDLRSVLSAGSATLFAFRTKDAPSIVIRERGVST
jgi:hypothetical protein